MGNASQDHLVGCWKGEAFEDIYYVVLLMTLSYTYLLCLIFLSWPLVEVNHISWFLGLPEPAG